MIFFNVPRKKGSWRKVKRSSVGEYCIPTKHSRNTGHFREAEGWSGLGSYKRMCWNVKSVDGPQILMNKSPSWNYKFWLKLRYISGQLLYCSLILPWVSQILLMLYNDQKSALHKVRVYKEYHSVCPLVGIGTLPTPLSQRMCPFPPEPGGGGAHSPACEGLGESLFRRLEKSLALCLYSVVLSLNTVTWETCNGDIARKAVNKASFWQNLCWTLA